MPSSELMDKAKRKFSVWNDEAATELDKLRANPPSISTDAKGYAQFLVLQELQPARLRKPDNSSKARNQLSKRSASSADPADSDRQAAKIPRFRSDASGALVHTAYG